MRKLVCLVFAAASLLYLALPTPSAQAREVCRRVCDAYGECERRGGWVRDGDRERDREGDRARRRSNESEVDQPPPQRRTAPPVVTRTPPAPAPAVQPSPFGGAGKQGPKAGPAGPAAAGGACVASGFAKLSRNCSTNVGGCQRMPESCSRGWCCP
jgi:hypothetical protein